MEVQISLALTHVEYGEKMKDVLIRLLAIVRKRGVKIRYLLLDKGFYSVSVIRYLRRIKQGYIIPVLIRGRKKLLFAIWKVRMTPVDIRETYRKRFGIETNYRQMNEARIKTCTRNPRLRLLFVGIVLVLRNVWVWLHFKLAKGKSHEEPQLFLELLRFREMLLWIAQAIQQALGADKTKEIDLELYQRLTKNA